MEAAVRLVLLFAVAAMAWLIVCALLAECARRRFGVPHGWIMHVAAAYWVAWWSLILFTLLLDWVVA